MTPHVVNYIDEESPEFNRVFQPHGLIRLSSSTQEFGETPCGCRLSVTTYGEPTGLPPYEEATITFCIHCGYEYPYEQKECSWCGEDGHLDYMSVPKAYYIVSQLVKNALPHRRDLIVPAEVVRDDTGNIIGCRSFGL